MDSVIVILMDFQSWKFCNVDGTLPWKFWSLDLDGSLVAVCGAGLGHHGWSRPLTSWMGDGVVPGEG